MREGKSFAGEIVIGLLLCILLVAVVFFFAQPPTVSQDDDGEPVQTQRETSGRSDVRNPQKQAPSGDPLDDATAGTTSGSSEPLSPEVTSDDDTPRNDTQEASPPTDSTGPVHVTAAFADDASSVSKTGRGASFQEALTAATAEPERALSLAVSTDAGASLQAEDFRYLREEMAGAGQVLLVSLDLSCARIEQDALPDGAFRNVRHAVVRREAAPAAVSLEPISAEAVQIGPVYDALPEAASEMAGPFDSLREVLLPETVQRIGAGAFADCVALRVLKAANAKELGKGAFQGCTALIQVDLPLVLTVEDETFDRCAALTRADLLSAERIGAFAFAGCTRLAAVHLPQTGSVGDGAFEGCAALRAVLLQKAVTVGRNAFEGCTTLREAVLPQATSLGVRAFTGCDALRMLYAPKLRSMGQGTFGTAPGPAWLHLPALETLATDISGCETLYAPALRRIGPDVSLRTLRTLIAPSLETADAAPGEAFFDRAPRLRDLFVGRTIPPLQTAKRRFADGEPRVFSSFGDGLAAGYPETARLVSYGTPPEPFAQLVLSAEKPRVGAVVNAEVLPGDASVSALSVQRYWFTDRPDILQVGEDGSLTALAAGRANLWCLLTMDVLMQVENPEEEHSSEGVLLEGWPTTAAVALEVMP